MGERDLLVEAEKKKQQQYKSKLEELFYLSDLNNDGFISMEDLTLSLKDPMISTYFHALDIATLEVTKLFDLLDSNGDGEVPLEEFLEGCLKIHGQAKNMDIQYLVLENKKSVQKSMEVMNYLEEHFQDIRSHV